MAFTAKFTPVAVGNTGDGTTEQFCGKGVLPAAQLKLTSLLYALMAAIVPWNEAVDPAKTVCGLLLTDT